ncbi:L,D-transpeptidase [Candidatus Cyanaurora vandensis]|uniref:L,D-transpeptidase n=1 Tax=Candidatus Cyanaurora vandensis TaxID=2714958 RepID=UPI0025794F02|nr:L,D-transpeptidase [Candidatus Cyanaurora vandensis]
MRCLLLLLWLVPSTVGAREILSSPQEQQQQQKVSLTLDLQQRRLTVWSNGLKLHQFPVAVGKTNWTTPRGQFQILSKIPNPAWEHIRTGEQFPSGVPGNPLGPYYLGFKKLGRDEFGLHGTNQPQSIGKAITHGCVRLQNQHIQVLYPLVQVGTPLRVF